MQEPEWGHSEESRNEEALYCMLAWQQRRCAICGRLESNRGFNRIDALYVDHDRATGLVRGWLCRGCNTTEGRHNVTVARYRKYRAKNPASILGLKIPYSSSWVSKRLTGDDRARLSARLHEIRDQIKGFRSAGQGTPERLVDELLEIATIGVRGK